jgi:hypothetical protein
MKVNSGGQKQSCDCANHGYSQIENASTVL